MRSEPMRRDLPAPANLDVAPLTGGHPRQLVPVVGVSGDLRPLDRMPHHGIGDKYLRPIVEAVGAIPLIVPALGTALDPRAIVGALDGLLVTGSPSNVEPSLYGGEASAAGTLHDPARDATTLPLIRAALDAGLPVFAICRGIQELNVALGGTLHQRVADVPGRMSHHGAEEAPPDEMYGEAHPVSFAAGGLFSSLTGVDAAMVNSVHYQGLDRLAPRLAIEALAPDGTIEAVRVADAPGFAIGVQWHPEWQWQDNALSRVLFGAFAEAVHTRARRRAVA